jgi:hypothetical protein
LTAFPYIDLVKYFACGRKRLNKYSLIISDTIRYGVKILHRQRQVFGVSPRVADDAEHRAMRAMGLQSTPAEAADGPAPERHAGNIDFAANAPPHPFFLFRSRHAAHLFNRAHKFMPRNTVEVVVTVQQLHILGSYGFVIQRKHQKNTVPISTVTMDGKRSTTLVCRASVWLQLMKTGRLLDSEILNLSSQPQGDLRNNMKLN